MIWIEKRNDCLKRIMKTIRETDKYNLEHEDSKIIDMFSFENEIMITYGVTRKTASQWIRDGQAMVETEHNINLKHEQYLRSLTPEEKAKAIGEIEQEVKEILK